ncbi:CehA/McbA family metallohydrolase [Jiangella alkaliphila]|uniref:Polymerase/histidinol phosphatase N-terminal domain-containing protein n=1 Tax=Jiangella alkaliphila TaxID=419479 RepID=A0A1H2LUQ2_9ACTN|nr:CehA/McbA family metallohydrolase [Jiangella alkaliphila]SDU84321.1 hypothetical protein SAMN04488563_6639 [Jiangella alkaliphila]
MSDTEEHPHEHGEHADGLSRRDVLAAGAGGLILAATASGSSAAVTRTASGAPGAVRASRLTRGRTLVHADLHNHTMLSDGAGDPALAYESMRSAGLDVAALTDHATLSDGVLSILDPLLPDGVNQITGLSRPGWRRTRDLADAADEPGLFTAIRGFEWTNPLLGHVNVWFTDAYTDVLDATLMGGFYRWLTREDGFFGIGDGGADGLAGFNHPGREPGRFNDFRYEPKAHDQLVSLEMFNRYDDYLFEGWAKGVSSPLVTCLNAGWRPGLSGVTDEHGTDWGYPEGKGRTGMWVTENTRDAVFQAMTERRFFATRASGLRLDATADGAPMGGSIRRARGDVRFAVDLDRGAEWTGNRLDIQVLRPGEGAPEVADVVEAAAGRVTRFTVPLDSDDGDWVVLRVSDPSQPNGTPGPDGHPCNDFGVAYSSPWWFDPA